MVRRCDVQGTPRIVSNKAEKSLILHLTALRRLTF